MPVGDQIVAAGAGVWPLAEIRTLLTGETTDFQILPTGIRGLGIGSVKTADVQLDHADGAYGSPDYQGVRIITIPYTIGGGTPADAMDNLTLLLVAWAPSTSDIELHLQLPGWGHVYVTGRPRGVDEDLIHLKSGEIGALATFHALDPTINDYP